MLNRSPSTANAGRQSHQQMLTKKIPMFSDIVVFGSTWTMQQDAKNKSSLPKGKQDLIVGKSDGSKGYRGYIPGAKVVVVTQHVMDVDTLTRQQNDHQLRAQHEEEVRGVRDDLAPQETTQATVQSRERIYRTRTS